MIDDINSNLIQTNKDDQLTEQNQPVILKSTKAISEGSLIAESSDSSGLNFLKLQSQGIDASLKNDNHIDLNQMISSMAMTQQGFISNLRDYLRARTNELLSIVNNDVIQGPGENIKYISDGTSLFPTAYLHTAISNGREWVMDVWGTQYKLDDVVERLSSIVQSSYTQDAFLESLQNSDSLGTDVTNDFINGVRLRVGELTSSAANYAAYVKSILATPASPIEKIMSLFTSGVPDESVEEIQDLNSPDNNYTGVNGAMAWCSDAISKLSGVDVDSFINFARAVRRIRATWPLIVARCYMKIVKKAFPVVKNAVVTTFVDPIDIQLSNNGLGFDKSIETSVVDITDQFIIYSDSYPNLYNKINDHFAWIESADYPGDVVPVNPSYLVFPTFGATYYIKPIRQSMSTMGIRVSIQAARHLYYKATNMIGDLLTIQPHVDQTFGELMYSWLGSYVISSATPYPLNVDKTREFEVYNDFVQSNRLMLLGLAFTSGSESTISTVARYYSDSEGLPDKFNWLSYSGTKSESAMITNADWINAVTSFSPSMSQDDIENFRDFALQCFEQGLASANTVGIYTPYTWSFCQLPGSYTINCDADNIAAFGAKVKTVAVIAIAVAATIAACKITKQLRISAFEKQKRALTALQYEDASVAYRYAREAKIASRLAGISFPDVISDSISLFTVPDSTVLRENYSRLANVNGATARIEASNQSIISSIQELLALIK